MEIISLPQLGDLFQKSNQGRIVILAKEQDTSLKDLSEFWLVSDSEKFLDRASIGRDVPLIKIPLNHTFSSKQFEMFGSDDDLLELRFYREGQNRTYRLFDPRYYELLRDAILERTITWGEYISSRT